MTIKQGFNKEKHQDKNDTKKQHKKDRILRCVRVKELEDRKELKHTQQKELQHVKEKELMHLKQKNMNHKVYMPKGKKRSGKMCSFTYIILAFFQ